MVLAVGSLALVSAVGSLGLLVVLVVGSLGSPGPWLVGTSLVAGSVAPVGSPVGPPVGPPVEALSVSPPPPPGQAGARRTSESEVTKPNAVRMAGRITDGVMRRAGARGLTCAHWGIAATLGLSRRSQRRGWIIWK